MRSFMQVLNRALIPDENYIAGSFLLRNVNDNRDRGYEKESFSY